MIEACPLVPVLSCSVDVSPTASYPIEEMPTVRSMDTTIKFVGGINKPKLVGG